MVVYQFYLGSILFHFPLSSFSSTCLQLVIGRFAVSLASVFVRYRQGEWRPGKKTGFGVTFTHVSDTYHLLHQINMASECGCVGGCLGVCMNMSQKLSSYLLLSFLPLLHL